MLLLGDLRTVWRVLGLFGAFWGWSGMILDVLGRFGDVLGHSGVTEVTGVECEKILRNIPSNIDISINRFSALV